MSNFELLYEISEKIINKQDELYYLMINKEIDNTSLEYQKIFDELKLLILKEEDFLSLLKIADIDVCICDLKTLLENNFEVTKDDDLNSFDGMEKYVRNLVNDYDGDSLYNPDVLLRVCDRLTNRSYILSGEGLNMKIHCGRDYIVDYKVSLWDVIISELNILVLKKLKNKLYSLVPNNSEEEKFVKDLKFNLESLKLSVLFGNFASEIKGVCANNDLDKIKVTDIDKLKKLDVFELDMYTSLLIEEAKKHVDNLSDDNYVSNLIKTIPDFIHNPGCIFDFKEEVTAFEVLVLHMELETLQELYDYCLKNTNDDNYPCMSGINNFVKARIKRKTN